MLTRYVLTTTHDPYAHHVGDTETLKELIEALTGDRDNAEHIAHIAGQMRLGDAFAIPGVLLTIEEDK